MRAEGIDELKMYSITQHSPSSRMDTETPRPVMFKVFHTAITLWS